ncbi:MAG: hypothetical protein WCK70_08215 [Chloroflexales bacterium]|jgi:PDZ domain-containing secreted protein
MAIRYGLILWSLAIISAVPFQVLGPGGSGHLSGITAIAGGEHHNSRSAG